MALGSQLNPELIGFCFSYFGVTFGWTLAGPQDPVPSGVIRTLPFPSASLCPVDFWQGRAEAVPGPGDLFLRLGLFQAPVCPLNLPSPRPGWFPLASRASPEFLPRGPVHPGA